MDGFKKLLTESTLWFVKTDSDSVIVKRKEVPVLDHMEGYNLIFRRSDLGRRWCKLREWRWWFRFLRSLQPEFLGLWNYFIIELRWTFNKKGELYFHSLKLNWGGRWPNQSTKISSLQTTETSLIDFHGLENVTTLMTVPQLQIQTVHSKTDLPL